MRSITFVNDSKRASPAARNAVRGAYEAICTNATLAPSNISESCELWVRTIHTAIGAKRSIASPCKR